MDATRSHETVERTTFHEKMDRNAPIENKNSTNVQDSIELLKGSSTYQATHGTKRSLGNFSRTSLFGIKKWLGWYNYKINEGKKENKEIGRWIFGKSL